MKRERKKEGNKKRGEETLYTDRPPKTDNARLALSHSRTHTQTHTLLPILSCNNEALAAEPTIVPS